MTHIVRSRNLAYSVKDIKRITCAKNKPRFYKTPSATFIKASVTDLDPGAGQIRISSNVEYIYIYISSGY